MSDSIAPDAVEFLLGRCDEMRAEAFVRVATPAGGEPARISGTLTGPRRGRDTTLPVTARLQVTATPGMSRAILTEPAYWTPDLPNLYRLEATLERRDGPPVAIDRLVGLRRLGVRGRSLWLDGRRWVPRGVAAGAADLVACKAAALAAFITEPDDVTLSRADETGAAVIVLVDGTTACDPESLARRIARWAAHPSAVVVVLPVDLPATVVAEGARAAADRKSTLLLAAAVVGSAPATTPPGIDALVVTLDADATPHGSWRAGAAVPLIAWRRTAAAPDGGRAPCDALQAELASWARDGVREILPWDWAGYIVG